MKKYIPTDSLTCHSAPPPSAGSSLVGGMGDAEPEAALLAWHQSGSGTTDSL